MAEITTIAFTGEQYAALRTLNAPTEAPVSIIQTSGPAKTYIHTPNDGAYYALTKAGEVKGPLTQEPTLLAG